MKIALDAMGGDSSPSAEVEGAILAARAFNTEIVLVGDEKLIRAELEKHKTANLPLSIHHASQRIEMHESPASALRRKKDSSIVVATNLVKEGKVSAVVSAGNTGATMAAGFFILGPVKGVERPAIATILPTLDGIAIMLDVGANVDCKPRHLYQFAIMGHVYATRVLQREKPRIGLLSIGEEDTKGNILTKETFRHLKDSPLNFIGNVEGRDVYSGSADVVVCDGFIGNVALKISEGVAETINKLLRREIEKSIFGKIGYLFLKPAFKSFKKKVDYAEYGGAPLLGVNGGCIICHGRSTPKAIKNAITMAIDFTRMQTIDYLQEDLNKFMNFYGEDLN
ncbi:MAG: phosphate acyltransferase PlsX [Nitrospirae bacterium]|nr:phosphate acyltransferase PlsX [Nitrospirota bacterium]